MTRGLKQGGNVVAYIDTSGLFSKGHLVWDWHYKIAKEVEILAVIEAPKRTGSMSRSIKAVQPSRTLGPYSSFLEAEIRVTRYYARFVHGGTTGPITSKSGGPMIIGGIHGERYRRKNGPGSKRNIPKKGERSTYDGIFTKKGGGPRVRGEDALRGRKKRNLFLKKVPYPAIQQSVAGQKANPFLGRAISQVSAKHHWKQSRTVRDIVNG